MFLKSRGERDAFELSRLSVSRDSSQLIKIQRTYSNSILDAVEDARRSRVDELPKSRVFERVLVAAVAELVDRRGDIHLRPTTIGVSFLTGISRGLEFPVFPESWETRVRVAFERIDRPLDTRLNHSVLEFKSVLDADVRLVEVGAGLLEESEDVGLGVC